MERKICFIEILKAICVHDIFRRALQTQEIVITGTKTVVILVFYYFHFFYAYVKKMSFPYKVFC